MKVVAHRGGMGEATENTIEAFMRAFNFADVIELDVWLTKDEKVVVFHDENLERMTGLDGYIRYTNYSDLPPIRPTVKNLKVGNVETFHKIPLLEEVFQSMPEGGHPVIVEIKQHSNVLVKEVDRLIKKYELCHKSIWFSLDYDISKLLVAKDINRPRIMSVAEIFQVYAMYFTGILPLVPTEYISNGSCIFGTSVVGLDEELVRDIPIFKHASSKVISWIISLSKELLLSKGLFAHLRRRGFKCIAMNVDDKKALRIASKNKYDLCLTDRPGFISFWMNSDEIP